jgi:hypothetical protein
LTVGDHSGNKARWIATNVIKLPELRLSFFVITTTYAPASSRPG